MLLTATVTPISFLYFLLMLTAKNWCAMQENGFKYMILHILHAQRVASYETPRFDSSHVCLGKRKTYTGKNQRQTNPTPRRHPGATVKGN